MRFDPELFARGQSAYLQQQSDNANRARVSLESAYQADDTKGIEDARRTLEGKGGLLGRLFDPGERSHGLENPYIQPKPGEDPYSMRVADMKGLNGPEVYSRLEKGFQGDLGTAQNNEDIARAFNKYQSAVEKADRYFKNDNAGKLDIRQYIRSGGDGGGGKVEKVNVYDKEGKLLNMVSVPAAYLSNEKMREEYLKQNYPKLYAETGGEYTLAPSGAGPTGFMNDEMRQMFKDAERKKVEEIIDKYEGVFSGLRRPPTESEKVLLAKYGYGFDGQGIYAKSKNQIDNKSEANIKQIPKVWRK